MFKDLEQMVFFIGPHRTGTSIIKCIIDSHPYVMVSHELGRSGIYEKIFQNKISRNQAIEQFIQAASLKVITSERIFSDGKRGNYCNVIKNGYQGKFEKLKIVGDKSAPWLCDKILQYSNAYEILKSFFQVEIKFVHVIRNPYDVASILINDRKRSVKKFIENCGGVKKFKEICPNNIIDIYLEKFQNESINETKRLFDFLKLEYSDRFITFCSETVLGNNFRRFDYNWTNEEIEVFEKEYKKYEWLKNYSFKEN